MQIETSELLATAGKRGRPRIPLLQRLLKYRKVQGDHWIWTGAKSKGYGILTLWTSRGRTTTYVSRVVAFLFLGLDLNDRDQLACHKNSCHLPLCFNPEHLYVGTWNSNVQDRNEVGTNVSPKGSEHYNARFTESEVLRIRSDHAGGAKIRELAGRYEVNYCTIEHMVKRLTWRHV